MSAGKGDKPRLVDGDKYCENYERIFGKKKPKSEQVKNVKIDKPA
jgi:hypothetical protein